jgi:amino-acid N-acetyltransferase
MRKNNLMQTQQLLKVRPAASTDWQGVIELLLRCELPLNGARDHLADYTVAVDAEGIVGVVGLEIYGTAALLRSVAVEPGRQNHGIGTLLLRHILDEAAHKGIDQIALLTTSAARFFVRFGFCATSREAAPRALLQSREFQGVCPSSATVMTLAVADRVILE